jgi:hypothetical protein
MDTSAIFRENRGFPKKQVINSIISFTWNGNPNFTNSPQSGLCERIQLGCRNWISDLRTSFNSYFSSILQCHGMLHLNPSLEQVSYFVRTFIRRCTHCSCKLDPSALGQGSKHLQHMVNSAGNRPYWKKKWMPISKLRQKKYYHISHTVNTHGDMVSRIIHSNAFII